MAAAAVGVSTAFSVGAAASVQLGNANTARQYIIICNLDPVNFVYICFGTKNAATVLAGIPIPPGGSYEQGPFPIQADGHGLVPLGDAAAVAQQGTTVNVSYYEK